MLQIGSTIYTAAGSCHTISSKQELEKAVAEIGN